MRRYALYPVPILVDKLLLYSFITYKYVYFPYPCSNLYGLILFTLISINVPTL